MRIISFNETKIYTDGACSGNPGKGGWAAIILDDDTIQSSISGSVKHYKQQDGVNGSNNGFKKKKKSEITIITDSRYVKDGITEWIQKWRINGWKTQIKNL